MIIDFGNGSGLHFVRNTMNYIPYEFYELLIECKMKRLNVYNVDRHRSTVKTKRKLKIKLFNDFRGAKEIVILYHKHTNLQKLKNIITE